MVQYWNFSAALNLMPQMQAADNGRKRFLFLPLPTRLNTDSSDVYEILFNIDSPWHVQSMNLKELRVERTYNMASFGAQPEPRITESSTWTNNRKYFHMPSVCVCVRMVSYESQPYMSYNLLHLAQFPHKGARRTGRHPYKQFTQYHVTHKSAEQQ